ncbi:MAG: Rieske 2Fe-2S domain-containing protein [Dehalococcoidia bacterium]
MLTEAENKLLSQVGPGTPGGELMRRYWHPIAASVQLDDDPVRAVRILGEDLVLFKDRQGRLGLIAKRCPHRMMDMRFGIPEDEGLRCPYHGWLYDTSGMCLEMPLEPPGTAFKEKIVTKSYLVQELGGLVWTYMGPDPAPLLPRWDLFVRPDGFRQIVGHSLPCNWLQVMENRGDLGHAIYLHGRLFQWALEKQGRLTDDPKARYNVTMKQQDDRLERGVYPKYRPVYNQFGFTKGNLDSDKDEDDPLWTVGRNPILFPYHLAFGPGSKGIRQTYQIGVPVDDTHTWHFQYFCYVFPPGVDTPEQDSVPYVEAPLTDESGAYILDNVLSQDMVAWYGQGEVADRTQEHLGVSDACVIAYRKLLKEQIEIVQKGGEPINVFRDPSTIERPELALVPESVDMAPVGGGRSDGTGATVYYRSNFHKVSQGGWLYLDDDVDRYCPDRDTIVELYRRTDELLSQREASGDRTEA